MTELFGTVAGGALQPESSYETYLLPALAVQISLVVASSSGIGLVDDIESGVFQKTLVTPMNRAAVFMGKTLSELIRIVVQVLIILGLGVVLGGGNVATGILGGVAIVGIAILFSLWFLAFSNTVALITRDRTSTIVAATVVQLPLQAVSSALLPVRSMMGWL